ncbi:MAG: ABC transporter permease [Promethearchaeota archaeon]
MDLKEIFRRNISQIVAITEKNVKFSLRFKFNLIISFIIPIISIIMPLILMGRLFDFNTQYGPWSADNFIIYQFTAYNITLLRMIITDYPKLFAQEKYWETLPALIIAPFKRINLVFGIFLSNIVLLSIPFTIFFVLSCILYPILPLTILFVLTLYFLIALIFSGIGVIIGVFAISKEGFLGIFNFLITFIFWFSCISYPFEVFPGIIQSIIQINPLYYIFDILRISWIENDVVLSISMHYLNFLIITLCAISLPLIGVYIFNKIYRKYGIVGY